jgi:Uma2 family endonuclease
MKTVVLGDPPPVLASLIDERKRLGLDTHDEVWEGEYHMAPAAAFRHGAVQARLVEILAPLARAAGLAFGLEFNLGHKNNFRVPDLGVHCGSPEGVWLKSAAVVVEVRSPDDESLQKFGFYAAHEVDELLIVDLVSETVTWHRRNAAGDGYDLVLGSELLPITSARIAAELGY